MNYPYVKKTINFKISIIWVYTKMILILKSSSRALATRSQCRRLLRRFASRNDILVLNHYQYISEILTFSLKDDILLYTSVFKFEIVLLFYKVVKQYFTSDLNHYEYIMKVLEKTNEVILSCKEYEALIDQIEELEDIVAYYETKDASGRPWEDVKKDLGLDV